MKLQPITVFPAWQQIERHAVEMQNWLETQSGREIDARLREMSDEELIDFMVSRDLATRADTALDDGAP